MKHKKVCVGSNSIESSLRNIQRSISQSPWISRTGHDDDNDEKDDDMGNER